MRSFLDPALFSSSCKASGQEAIHFPLAHTHLHLEPSHAHFAGGSSGWTGGPALASLLLHSQRDFQQLGLPGGSVALAKSLGRDMELGGGLASSADKHLLQTSLNVSVASTTFITRGAERLWGALMGCKKLFPLCLLGRSPIQSGGEPRSGTEVTGTCRGRRSLCLSASAPWSICSTGSACFGKEDKFQLVSPPALSVPVKKKL